MSEAEAQDRDIEIEDAGVEPALVARRQRRTARQNDALDAVERGDGIFRLANFGQHALPPDFRRDQMRVLATKINYGYSIMHEAIAVYFRLNVTVTVSITGTATPFSFVGV